MLKKETLDSYRQALYKIRCLVNVVGCGIQWVFQVLLMVQGCAQMRKCIFYDDDFFFVSPSESERESVVQDCA